MDSIFALLDAELRKHSKPRVTGDRIISDDFVILDRIVSLSLYDTVLFQYRFEVSKIR